MSFPLIPELPADEKARIAAIENVGVVCVLLKLKRPFTRNFWMNINDPRIEIPGLIEYSNLNPLDGSVDPVRALLHAAHATRNTAANSAPSSRRRLAACRRSAPTSIAAT